MSPLTTLSTSFFSLFLCWLELWFLNVPLRSFKNNSNWMASSRRDCRIIVNSAMVSTLVKKVLKMKTNGRSSFQALLLFECSQQMSLGKLSFLFVKEPRFGAYCGSVHFPWFWYLNPITDAVYYYKSSTEFVCPLEGLCSRIYKDEVSHVQFKSKGSLAGWRREPQRTCTTPRSFNMKSITEGYLI